jgi:DNA-binding HxlR family transcriptional regulator
VAVLELNRLVPDIMPTIVDDDLRDAILGNPVGRAIAVIGDAWTQLILRDAFFGVHRFSDWRDNLGLPRSVLVDRLQRLVSAGLLEQRVKPGSVRSEYHLTPMGLDLFGVSVMQGQWERMYAPEPQSSRYAIVFFDRETGERVRFAVLDRPRGKPIDPRRITYVRGPGIEQRLSPVSSRRRRIRMVPGSNRMIERSVEIIGDYWSGALLAATFFRLRRFDEFSAALNIASNILTDRLNRFVADNILERRPYQDGPIRFEYRLTAAGRALYPVVLAMYGWSERWLCDFENPPMKLVDRETGKRITPVVCDVATGRPADAKRIRWEREMRHASVGR